MLQCCPCRYATGSSRHTGTGSPGAHVLAAARTLATCGFRLLATSGTVAFLAENGVVAEPVAKLHEGSPTMGDLIRDGVVDLDINTPAGASSEYDDSYIRKAAIRARKPYMTTTSEALAAAEGIRARLAGAEGVRSLQEYHALIR